MTELEYLEVALKTVPTMIAVIIGILINDSQLRALDKRLADLDNRLKDFGSRGAARGSAGR